MQLTRPERRGDNESIRNSLDPKISYSYDYIVWCGQPVCGYEL